MTENINLNLINTASEQLRMTRQRAEEESALPTIIPAYQLITYNELAENYNQAQSYNAEHKRGRLKEIELAYKLKSDLVPTIGVELELPKTSVSKEQQEVIEGCGISVKSDWGDTMTEIAPDFSYSAHTQSRILEECAHLGVNEKDIKNEKETESSLHINFGIPNDIEVVNDKGLDTEARTLVDAITYGFVSPARIMGRKTLESVNIKSAPSGPSMFRLEVRTADFASQNTFRLLEESQLLAGACFSYLQDLSEGEVTEEQIKLSGIWSQFKIKIRELTDEFGIPADSERPIYNTDPKALQRILIEHPEIKDKFRLLITKTSKEIKEIVQLSV